MYLTNNTQLFYQLAVKISRKYLNINPAEVLPFTCLEQPLGRTTVRYFFSNSVNHQRPHKFYYQITQNFILYGGDKLRS